MRAGANPVSAKAVSRHKVKPLRDKRRASVNRLKVKVRQAKVRQANHKRAKRPLVKLRQA